MLLSGWREAAPNRECMSPTVYGVLTSVLRDLGADVDPDCWVVWGEDPEFKYSVLAPTPAGVITVAVRLLGVEGPRATAKLVRWSKLAVGEVSIEATAEHRIVAVQVEGLILKGVDEEADRICEFSRDLLAGIDGRLHTVVVAAPVVGAAAPIVGAAAPVVGAAASPTVASAPAAAPMAATEAEPEWKALPAPRKTEASQPAAKSGAKARAARPAKAGPRSVGPSAPQEAWVAPHAIGAPWGLEPEPATPVQETGAAEPVSLEPVTREPAPGTSEASIAPDSTGDEVVSDDSGSAGPASQEALNTLKKRPRLWVP